MENTAYPKFNADIGLLGAFEATHVSFISPGYEVYIMNVCHAEARIVKKNDAV